MTLANARFRPGVFAFLPGPFCAQVLYESLISDIRYIRPAFKKHLNKYLGSSCPLDRVGCLATSTVAILRT